MGGLAGSRAPHIIYRRALELCARRVSAARRVPAQNGQIHAGKCTPRGVLGVAALSAGVAGAHVEQVVAVNGLAY